MGEEFLDRFPELEQHGPVALQPETLELIEHEDERLIEAAQSPDHLQGL